MRRWIAGVLFAACGLSGGSTARADTPYGKTFIGTVQICSNRTGQCTGTQPFHVFLAKSGRLYSYLRSEGGELFPLGQYRTFGATQQRFTVAGNALVYDDIIDQNGSRLALRGYLRNQGGACTVTGSATLNGAPEPITTQASCEVYEGQR